MNLLTPLATALANLKITHLPIIAISEALILVEIEIILHYI